MFAFFLVILAETTVAFNLDMMQILSTEHLSNLLSSQGMTLKEVSWLMDPIESDSNFGSVVQALQQISFFSQGNLNATKCDPAWNSVVVDLTTNSSLVWDVDNYSPQCVWIFQDTPETLEKLKAKPPAFNSHVLLIKTNKTGLVSSREIYSPDPETIPAVVNVIEKDMKYNIWSRRGDLLGLKLNLVYVEAPNFIEVSQNGTEAKGMVFEVILALSKALNFTYDFTPSYDGTFGSMDSNGNWNGMIRMIMDGGFDLGASLTTITKIRSEVVDFSEILTISNNELWLKTSYKMDYEALIHMLTDTVWLFTLVTLFASFIIGIVLGRQYNTALQDPSLPPFSVVGLFLQQGTNVDTRKLAMKCLLFTIAVFSFFFFNAFSAHLTSSLTVHKFSDNIRSFDDLLANPEYDLYVPGGSSLAQSLHSAEQGSTRRRLWEEKVSRDPKFHTKDFSLIGKYFLKSESKAAIYTYIRIMSVWNRQNPGHSCNLRHIELKGDVSLGAFPMPKNSPYKEVIDHALRAWREAGIDENNFWEVTGRFQEDLCRQDENYESSGFGSVMTFFAMLSVGFGASVAVALLEYLKWFLFV